MRELFDARLNPDDKPMTQAQLAEAVKTADVLVPTVTDRIDAAVLAQAGRAAQADRQFRQRRRQYRRRHRGSARHHRHQHAGRADRGHRRHDHGADPRGAAPAGRRLQRADRRTTTGPAGRRPGCSATASGASASASSAWAGSARRWRGAPAPSACRSTTTTAARSRPRSRKSSTPPIGRASTRCSPAWTSCRSTARTRRRPITCCRRGGSSCCGPKPIIVNTARGEVIDENALARLIEAGDIAGAGLDVFEHEPAVNPKLVKLARAGKVVLLPHMGSATIEGRIDMGEKVIINIKTFMDGHGRRTACLPSRCCEIVRERVACDSVPDQTALIDRRTVARDSGFPGSLMSYFVRIPSIESHSNRARRPSAAGRPGLRRSRRSRGSLPAPSSNRECPAARRECRLRRRPAPCRPAAAPETDSDKSDCACRRRASRARASVVSEPSKVPTAAVTSGFLAK